MGGCTTEVTRRAARSDPKTASYTRGGPARNLYKKVQNHNNNFCKFVSNSLFSLFEVGTWW